MTSAHSSISNHGKPVAAARRRGTAGPGWPLVLALLLGLTLVGWAYLAAMIADMVPAMDMTEAGPGMGLFNRFNLYNGLSPDIRAAIAALCLPNQVATFGMPASSWTIGDAAKVFLMWTMMTFAMMIPSIIPMVRSYMRQGHDQPSASRTLIASFALVCGYVSIWLTYAIVATTLQWILTLEGMLSSMMAPVSLAFSASILIAAGIYQLTPAKYACLLRCWYPRFTPMDAGSLHPAFREGMVQGLACLGCCWAVMAVMFAVGLMNVVWVAVLGILISVEKTVVSFWFRYVVGAFMISWGGALAALAGGRLPL